MHRCGKSILVSMALRARNDILMTSFGAPRRPRELPSRAEIVVVEKREMLKWRTVKKNNEKFRSAIIGFCNSTVEAV